MTSNEKNAWALIGVGIACLAVGTGVYQYNTNKERAIREKKVENERLYFEKLTPEQVENLEKEKLAVKKAEIELKSSEAELKKTVADFKNDIHDDILEEVMATIKDDMRETFDNWSGKFEDRLDKKVDRVVSRIDDLSDKYGGVKEAGSNGPTISVVNAPNN